MSHRGVLLAFFFLPNVLFAEFTPATMLEKLKAHDDMLSSIAADLEIRTSAPGAPVMVQTGNYYYAAPDRVRLEILHPGISIMIRSGNTAYMKLSSNGDFKTEKIDPSDSRVANDIYQYRFLESLILEIDSSRSDPPNDQYLLTGFRLNNGNKAKVLEVLFDDSVGLVKSYNLEGLGQAGSMNVDIEYSSIDGLSIPTKTTGKVVAGGTTIRNVIHLRNTTVNSTIDPGLFTAK